MVKVTVANSSDVGDGAARVWRPWRLTAAELFPIQGEIEQNISKGKLI